MKKISFVLIASFLTAGIFAQNDKYITAMQPKVMAIDTTHSTDALIDLAGAFERIGDAEKTQWLPYYYAALANVNAGNMIVAGSENMMGNNSEKLDPYADKAQQLISKAEALSKDNSEIYLVKKMIASLHMMGDPMNRYATYGSAASEAMEMAKKLNMDNPRIYLLEGIDKFYTPEQYGGSKEEAKKLFEEAQKKYESFTPESPIHPDWGRNQLRYFFAQIK